MTELRDQKPTATATAPAADAVYEVGLRECLVRAAVHAAAEGDTEFFLACERRWQRTFAPDGPMLADVIEGALEFGLPPEEELTLRG
jgi:hypothetical protein